MAAARRWRRKCRTRDAVLALLLVSVLAPLALYSGAPISAFSGPALTGSAFGRDPSNLIARNEAGKRLRSLRQDAFGALKDPVRTVASDARVKREGTAIAGIQGTQLGQDGGIQQVVTGSSIDISGESGSSKDGRARNVDEGKQASHDSSKRKRVDAGVPSLDEGAQYREQSGVSNVGAARDNKVRGMHNAGHRNVPSDKEITDDRSSEKIAGALLTSSNTSYSTASPDNTILVMKDQLKRARRYNRFLPSRGNHGFVKDLRRRTRDIQQALSGSTVDRKLPKKYFFFIRITKFFTLGVYSDDARDGNGYP